MQCDSHIMVRCDSHSCNVYSQCAGTCQAFNMTIQPVSPQSENWEWWMRMEEDSCTVRLRASNQQTWICLTDLNELITNPLSLDALIISGWPLSVFVQQRSRLFVGGDLALVLCASQIQGPKVSCLWPGCHRIRTYGSRGRAVFYWHVALNMLCPWSHHVSPQIWILSDSASLWHPLGMAKRFVVLAPDSRE